MTRTTGRPQVGPKTKRPFDRTAPPARIHCAVAHRALRHTPSLFGYAALARYDTLLSIDGRALH
ncbi:hypothetical protein BVI1335_940017 [Burkholderia vietnamiensis]|nr:hypothetical protein BVI1335_940017 [Burkholderia vietnamiensis]